MDINKRKYLIRKQEDIKPGTIEDIFRDYDEKLNIIGSALSAVSPLGTSATNAEIIDKINEIIKKMG